VIALETQARFRSLLEAFSWPGRPVRLKAGPLPCTAARYLMAVAETLLDHEVTFAIIGDGLVEGDARSLSDQVRLRTGARPARPDEAEFVFVRGTAGRVIHELPVGDPEFPDRGATLIWRVDGFAGGLSATLRGPGIDGARLLRLAGVAAADLLALGQINQAYPLGLDTLFVDDQGTIVGLPRSTSIELDSSVVI